MDDLEDNRDLYRQFFTHKGFGFIAASSGPEGLAEAARVLPDVIVLDLGMPGMDGWEVITRLKADPATSAIPVIALTGHVTDESKRRALEAGVDEYCTKPCRPDELLAAVQRHLR